MAGREASLRFVFYEKEIRSSPIMIAKVKQQMKLSHAIVDERVGGIADLRAGGH